MLRSKVAAALSTVIFAVACTAMCARATEPDVAREASDFVEYLAFVGDGPLAEPERERVSAETQSQQRSDPAGMQRADGLVRKFLAALPHAEAWERADHRESMRLQIQLLPASDPARQIVERHDPVVVFDPTHKRLVTEGTLTVWRRAGDWMADLLSVPRPGADFVANERAYVKAHYASLPEAQQDAVAHVERNYPVTVLMLARGDPAKRADFVRAARPLALDQKQFGMRLADAMSKSYDIALQQQIVNASILLNSGFDYNGLYHTMYNHP